MKKYNLRVKKKRVINNDSASVTKNNQIVMNNNTAPNDKINMLGQMFKDMVKRMNTTRIMDRILKMLNKKKCSKLNNVEC